MLDSRQENLLNRILVSRQFSHAESLKRILTYICENSNSASGTPIREHDLGVNALGRPASFDPRSDPIVRVSVEGIRERLRSYFEDEGAREPICLEIPAGEFRAVYKESAASEIFQRNGSAARQFWRPYVSASVPNILVYAEVLFFRDDQGNYVRNVYVNDVATGEVDIRPHLPNVDFDRFSPSYHYASAGDMHCVLFVARQFQELGVGLEVRTARFTSWNELGHSNLIFVGSCRTSPFIDSLQGEQPFVLTDSSIRNRYPRPDERSEYLGQRRTKGKTEKLTEYALITRHVGLSADTATTIISGNHGRAIEAAGFLLTREDALEQLLKNMDVSTGDALPAQFQILLEVEMADFSEDVVSVEYLTHRVF